MCGMFTWVLFCFPSGWLAEVFLAMVSQAWQEVIPCHSADCSLPYYTLYKNERARVCFFYYASRCTCSSSHSAATLPGSRHWPVANFCLTLCTHHKCRGAPLTPCAGRGLLNMAHFNMHIFVYWPSCLELQPIPFATSSISIWIPALCGAVFYSSRFTFGAL